MQLYYYCYYYYDYYYATIIQFHPKRTNYFSHACSIQEDDRVIITGGHSTTTVSVYDENGWKEDLSNLNFGRSGHACTSFVSGGKKVCLIYLMCI